MKLVIPMAGRGTRLRPHTHVTPKPLLSVVGIPMIERIVNTFIEVLPRPLTEAVFVLGDFPSEVNDALSAICANHDMKASFVYQDVARGTAHAVHCAADYLDGEVIVVFADTLFMMDGPASLDDADVVTWVKHVDDPRRFGVVVKEGDRITALVEKPAEIISNEALIGIYYVREGHLLRTAIQKIMDDEITGHGGEYQLTDAFDLLLKQGVVFKTNQVSEWLDCGTLEALMDTSRVLLEKNPGGGDRSGISDSVIIEPVFIGAGATVSRSVIGPNVVIESGATVSNSIIAESIVFDDATVTTANLNNSMVGKSASVTGRLESVNIGDHASIG